MRDTGTSSARPGVVESLDRVQTIIGAGPTGPFDSLARHVHWLKYWHGRHQPERYMSDIVDLREHDLPGVVAAVTTWGHTLWDSGLLIAINASWTAQHYANAIRDAFIYLEEKLREVGAVDPTRGLSGDRLVISVLNPGSSTAIDVSADGFLGPLTGGEREGLFNLAKGAFLLFRNATAHRPIPYTAGQAEDVLHVINLCLRLISPATG